MARRRGYTFCFGWSCRKLGPLTPDMRLFDKLYQLGTDVEGGFRLTEANRYGMEQHTTGMGLDAVSIHVTLQKIAVFIDAVQRGRKLPRPGELTPRPVMPGGSKPDTR